MEQSEMHLLSEKQMAKLDFLLERLRGAAQTLLEDPSDKWAAHTVAASVEILEEMFHVEQTPPPDLTIGSGSPSSTTTGTSSNENYDHVREHGDRAREAPLASQGEDRVGRSTWNIPFSVVLKGHRAAATKKPPRVRRGRWKARGRRR